MTLTVFLAVLAAAAMHAAWNGLIKIRADRFASITLTTLASGLVAMPFLIIVPFPTSVVWPWIALSIVIHVGYRVFLCLAYDAGDMAQAYPLARGTAPLMATIGAVFLMGEIPGQIAMLGIFLLSAGTFLMSLRGGGDLDRFNRRAVGFALTTSVFIAGYTLTDGQGARLADGATSYAAWLFVCDGLCSTVLGFVLRGRRLLGVMAREWKTGLMTGALSAGSYWIAMWAMTQAPIASVAALRETSILFGMLLSVMFMGERATLWRLLAAALIAVGVIALRLG